MNWKHVNIFWIMRIEARNTVKKKTVQTCFDWNICHSVLVSKSVTNIQHLINQEYYVPQTVICENREITSKTNVCCQRAEKCVDMFLCRVTINAFLSMHSLLSLEVHRFTSMLMAMWAIFHFHWFVSGSLNGNYLHET